MTQTLFEPILLPVPNYNGNKILDHDIAISPIAGTRNHRSNSAPGIETGTVLSSPKHAGESTKSLWSSSRSERTYSSANSILSTPHTTTVENGLAKIEDQFCGWLWMRESKWSRWRHRYFCFNGALLSYFETFPSEEFLKRSQRQFSEYGDTTTVPRGVLRVGHVDDTKYRLGFTVFGTNGTQIEIRAHGLEQRNDWLRRLKTSARRKTRTWSEGDEGEIIWSLASFDPNFVCTPTRQSIAIVKSGWLLKKSDILKRWNRYFFVVQGQMLSYYATNKPYDVPRRRGYIISVHAGQSPRTHDLYIYLDSQSQNRADLHLRLETEEDLVEWRECLLGNIRGD